MGKLDNTIHLINTEKRLLLSVFDIDKATHLGKYIPASTILEKYGSGENYFEHLNAQGHKNLVLSFYKKNGTGRPKLTEPITVNFGNPIEENHQSVMQPVAPIQRTQAIPKNNMFSQFGLGHAEAIELFVEKNEATRLRTENAELKVENKSLKSENEKHREEILRDKYDYSKEKDKRESTHGLITGLMGALPMVMQHIKPAENGLGSPQPENFGSLIKNNFVQTVKELDDATVTMLGIIINEMTTNELFANDFIEVLQKHKLWQ